MCLDKDVSQSDFYVDEWKERHSVHKLITNIDIRPHCEISATGEHICMKFCGTTANPCWWNLHPQRFGLQDTCPKPSKHKSYWLMANQSRPLSWGRKTQKDGDCTNFTRSVLTQLINQSLSRVNQQVDHTRDDDVTLTLAVVVTKSLLNVWAISTICRPVNSRSI